MTIALLISFGTRVVRVQSVRVNFVCSKRLFNLSADAIINVRNASLCAWCAIVRLEEQTNSSCFSFGQGVHISEESPK